MKLQVNTALDLRNTQDENSLAWRLSDMVASCLRCNLCVKECRFLSQYGNPGEFAERFNDNPQMSQEDSFKCSLCGLCSSVCPKKLNPAALFLSLRKKGYENGLVNLKRYSGLLSYEKKGASKQYRLYHIPKNSDTVFFPGCSLPGTRPDKTYRAYKYLKEMIPGIGIVLDCCHKPSHDLGREVYFYSIFSALTALLKKSGIKHIIVACPNCYKVFNEYGSDFSLRTVYDVIADFGITSENKGNGTITIHDPCAVRFESGIHDSVRRLSISQGFKIHEMKHNRERTICCGEGGVVSCLSPDFSRAWTSQRSEEAGEHRIVTYCAGCAGYLSGKVPAVHILDLIFKPDKSILGILRVSKPPFTYFNRILLKRKLKKEIHTVITV